MKKVAVTGCLGFIGFALCQRLLENGIEVVGIDSMVNNHLLEIYEEKLHLVSRNALFQFYNEKVENLNVTLLFKDIETVYHLAAATRRDRSWGDLQSTIEDNVGVTGKIISACTKKTKLIYTSSIQVYGERTGIVTETTPLNPTTPYSLTKMAAESLIQTRCKEEGIPYVIFRLPTIYGPWQRSDMTFSQLIMNRLKGTSSTVDHDRVTEDALYIEDIIDTLINGGQKAGCKNQIYNLATGKKDEWFFGRALLSSDLPLQNVNERLQVTISNEKAKHELGFKAMTPIEAGIAAQKKHFEKYKHLYVGEGV